MLELIVLGTIPGTNIQINFWSLVISVASILILVEAFRLYRRHQKDKIKKSHDLKLIAH